jgi:hypothetical protein
MNDFHTVRRFTHVDKFKDDVSYIEYHDNKSVVFILNNGDKILGGKVDIKGFEVMVNQKKWKELKSYQIWPSTESHLFRDCY